MRFRAWMVGLVALASFAAMPTVRALALDDKAPAKRTNEFEKYVPEKSEFYVHINVPKLFTSELVRKAVPMAIDKYSDQIAQMVGMAKMFNPQMPDVPEEQIKEGLKKASDPSEIAKVFDAAKGFVTDIVIAGAAPHGGGDVPEMIMLFKSQMITPEILEMGANFAAMNPQAQGVVTKIKKSGGTVYAITPPQQDQKVYLCVPEKGILQMSFSEELAEAGFVHQSKPGEKLASLMTKRGTDDFVFVAMTGNDHADFTSLAFNLGLDKDISGKGEVEYKDAEKAAEAATEANKHLSEMAEQIEGALGEKGGELKAKMTETKAKAEGKKVTASMSIPGKVFEELLKKKAE